MDTSSLTDRVAAPAHARGRHIHTRGHRRRERVCRTGAAAPARRPSARARHGSDVVVAGRPAAHAAGARKNLGWRHRALLGRQAGGRLRRRVPGAPRGGRGQHCAGARRAWRPRHRPVRRLPAARGGGAGEMVSGDQTGLAEACLRPHRAQLRRDPRALSSWPTPGATRPPRCSHSSRSRKQGSSPAMWSSMRSPASRVRARSRATARIFQRITAACRHTACSATGISLKSSRSSARRSRSCRTWFRSTAAFSRRSTPGCGRSTTAAQVADADEPAYRDAPFVRLTGETLPEIKHAAYTNFCDIGWRVDTAGGRILLVAVIDNLVKGAAGQAIQNMNVMLGFDERTGLLPVRLQPDHQSMNPVVLKFGGELLEDAGRVGSAVAPRSPGSAARRAARHRPRRRTRDRRVAGPSGHREAAG